jgi:hypothetical protein
MTSPIGKPYNALKEEVAGHADIVKTSKPNNFVVGWGKVAF